MASRRRLTFLALAVAFAVAVTSFACGTVGALITGKEPFALFAVRPPHVELAAGHPFASAPLTNTLLASWLTAAVLIAVFLLSTRNVQLIPGRLQNFVEAICEVAIGFIEGMVGTEHERRFFPIVTTVFLFVIGNAWLGLLPGFETISLGGVPLLRSANTDMNVTLMLALVCVLMVEYWGCRARGLAYLKSFFDFSFIRAGMSNLRCRKMECLRQMAHGGVFLFVGLMALLGHAVRVVSFSFRLFGNMLAGVILTGVAIFLVPMVLPSVFYGLEMLFGLIQAVIFAGLTTVFGYAAVSATEH